MGTQSKSIQNLKTRPSRETALPLQILAGLTAVLFILVAVLGIIGYDTYRTLFNPTLVKQILTNEVLHTDLAPSVLEYVSENRAKERIASGEALSGVDEPDIVLLLSYLDAKDWREIKDLILTDDFLTHLVSVSVDGIYQWIDSSDPFPDIQLDLTTLKERLTGEAGLQVILIAFSKMPVCTQKEIDDFQARLASMPPGVEVLYNLCQFPDPWYEDQIGDYQNALIDFNQNFPDLLNFSELASTGEGAEGSNLTLMKTTLLLIRGIAQWGWALAVILLGFIGLVAVRTLRSLGGFIGIPLLLTGLLVGVFYLAVRPFLPGWITNSLSSSAPPLFHQEVTRGVALLTNQIFQPMLAEAGILAGIGLVLVILMFIKRK
jgi:hypothetical protein